MAFNCAVMPQCSSSPPPANITTLAPWRIMLAAAPMQFADVAQASKIEELMSRMQNAVDSAADTVEPIVRGTLYSQDRTSVEQGSGESVGHTRVSQRNNHNIIT